jgi:deoxyribodipyrimidine photo-lyase
VRDNPALFRACERADQGVVGLYIITPGQWRDHGDSAAKVDFWLRHAGELSESLARLQIPLLIVNCDSYRELPGKLVSVAKKHRCTNLYFNLEYEVNEQSRDAAVAAGCEQAGIQVHRYDDRVIVPPRNIATKEGRFYTIFTPFRRVWDSRLADAGEPLPAPRGQFGVELAPSRVPTTVKGFDFVGVRGDLWKAGEGEAHRRLAKFMERIDAYHEQRDLPAVNGTSLLSPYLAAGILSPRQCLAAALSSCRGDLSASPGAATWVTELTWRDFYAHVLVGFPRVSRHRAFNERNDSVGWRDSESDFHAWCAGATGYPIVDAGMRQLNQTGWMHNRLRMVTAMFLTKHLLIDWRWGERYFMSKLIDGDLAANNGGWQWSASTGTDAVPYFRIFNPFSQSKRFDPEGAFICKFCPELAAVSPAALHDAKKLAREIADKRIDYPRYVVDYQAGRARALAAFKQSGAP